MRRLRGHKAASDRGVFYGLFVPSRTCGCDRGTCRVTLREMAPRLVDHHGFLTSLLGMRDSRLSAVGLGVGIMITMDHHVFLDTRWSLLSSKETKKTCVTPEQMGCHATVCRLNCQAKLTVWYSQHFIYTRPCCDDSLPSMHHVPTHTTSSITVCSK